jgi:hypothetical protein
MLVGESGRKMVKQCIIRSLDICDPRHIQYFEGDEKKKKIKEDRVCGTCGRELERKRLLW